MNRKAHYLADELVPTRRSLLERLRNLDDQPSWREFFDTYWKLVYGAAIRAGLSDQEAEDVVQETVIGIARKMPEFHYDPAVCSFKGRLMQVTRCRITDRFRRRRPQNVPLEAPGGPDTTTDTALNLPDPSAAVLEDVWDDEWRKNLVDVAIERVRRRANPEHYQIFHLRAVKGLGGARRGQTHRRQPAQGLCHLSSHRQSRESRGAQTRTNRCPCVTSQSAIQNPKPESGPEIIGPTPLFSGLRSKRGPGWAESCGWHSPARSGQEGSRSDGREEFFRIRRSSANTGSPPAWERAPSVGGS